MDAGKAIAERKVARRRVSCDFSGDEAVELELLEVQIGITRDAASKSDRSQLLIRNAVLALSCVLDAYREESGNKYPDYKDVSAWLQSGGLRRKVGRPDISGAPLENMLSAENASQMVGETTIEHGTNGPRTFPLGEPGERIGGE